MALWKARALTPEQKVQIVEEESEAKSLQIAEEETVAKSLQIGEDEPPDTKNQTEESGSLLCLEDVSMSIAYSSLLSVPVRSLSLSLSLVEYDFHI